MNADFGPPELASALVLIDLALREDLGTAGDITSEAVIAQGARGTGAFVARAGGIIAGLPVVELLAQRFAVELECQEDGARLARGEQFGLVRGSYRQLLALERTALNFLTRLSGIATLTARFVAAVAGTSAVVLDTRKTTPGWRALEKYAVRRGGGQNHRFGLHDAVLIKDNHLASLGGGVDSIASAIRAARARVPAQTIVEVEVDSLEQLDAALAAGPDIVLVDNLGPAAFAEAVARRNARAPGVLLEASGGVTLETVGALARAGVDRISVGALTHSAPALDLALDFEVAS
jgi:nicotinate-nucleotide pyrophosphorylase (carboxylating)